MSVKAESLQASPARAVMGNAAIIMVFLGLSRILGFLREVVMAPIFGTSPAMDAYVGARTVPELLLNLVLGGVLGYAIIPVFVQLRMQHSEEEGWRLVSTVMNTLLMASFVAVVIGCVAAGPVVDIFAPGLEGPTRALAVQLSWILFPTLLFVVFSGISGAILNALGEFGKPALNGAIVNLSIILGVLILARVIGIASAAAGNLFGVTVQATLLAIALRQKGFRHSFILDWHSPYVRSAVAMTVPIVFMQALFYGRIIVGRLLASTLSSGSLAVLNYSDRLASLPVLIFANALNTAVFPSLSESAAVTNLDRLRGAVSLNLRTIAFMIIPASLVMVFFSLPIVKLVYERGAFDAQSTILTASLLRWSAITLLAQALVMSFSQVFFALRRVGPPLWVLSAGTVLNMVSSAFLARRYGVVGLGMGSAISVFFSVALLAILLLPKLRNTGEHTRTLALYLTKITAAALAACGVALVAMDRVLHLSTRGTLREIRYVAIALVIVFVVYVIALRLLRIGELAGAERRLVRVVGALRGGLRREVSSDK